jgi:hypothetical protein
MNLDSIHGEGLNMPNPPLRFSGITPEKFESLLQKAKDAGFNLAGNSGTAEKFGVEISWSYSPEHQMLTLQCMRTPFFVKADDVDAKLQLLVREALG